MTWANAYLVCFLVGFTLSLAGSAGEKVKSKDFGVELKFGNYRG